VVTPLDLRAVRDARDVVAAMHEVAVRAAVERLTESDVAAMRQANERFADALRRGDVDAALRADDELHGVPVAVAANAAIGAVLDQFTPVLRRAERLRFSTLTGRGSVARHDELIRLCQDGDAPGAAAVAFDTWHSLDASDHDEPDRPDGPVTTD
jgi:DNA-binding GntR family transcriptional regulator